MADRSMSEGLQFHRPWLWGSLLSGPVFSQANTQQVLRLYRVYTLVRNVVYSACNVSELPEAMSFGRRMRSQV